MFALILPATINSLKLTLERINYNNTHGSSNQFVAHYLPLELYKKTLRNITSNCKKLRGKATSEIFESNSYQKFEKTPFRFASSLTPFLYYYHSLFLTFFLHKPQNKIRFSSSFNFIMASFHNFGKMRVV